MPTINRIPSINRDRIDWCCKECGITADELADEVGLLSNRLERDSLQKDGLTYNQLKKVADFFQRGVLFFLETEPLKDEGIRSAHFRTLTNQKPDLSRKVLALIERVERQRILYLSLLEDIGEVPVRFQPPRVSRSNVTGAATIARKWLNLSEESTFEAYRSALEARGVLVLRSNGYAGKWQLPKDSPICGFSLYEDHCPVIFVRRLHPETRQTFTLMHELGHLLLHKSSTIDSEADLTSLQGKERDANQFAGSVLVPESFLGTIDDAQRPDAVSDYETWLKPYKSRWGVSGEVILLRLVAAGRLQQAEYDAYRDFVRSVAPTSKPTTGDRSYRHREPKHIFGTPFVRVVLDALNTDQISLARASSYLDNIRTNDVHALEEHIANL
ncbi:MAG: ImmA/IrrE family metallo-endopeptidase [Planctomycetota bacterium]|jgi:Zn-dependent peptidase ImmA (M78 family)